MRVGEEQGFLEEERQLADAIIPGGGESHGMQQIVAPQGVEDEDDRDPSVEEMREIIGEMDKAEALRSCEEEGIVVDEPDNVTLAAVHHLLLAHYCPHIRVHMGAASTLSDTDTRTQGQARAAAHPIHRVVNAVGSDDDFTLDECNYDANYKGGSRLCRCDSLQLGHT